MSTLVPGAHRFAEEHARTIQLLMLALASIGYLLCFRVLLENGIVFDGGGGGGDVLAYWTAGANVVAGRPVYELGVGGFAAFLYPPPIAQLFAPLSLLPFPAVVWGWRVAGLVGLRLAVGSWTWAGLAMLFWPPVIVELAAANVHLLIAGAVGLAIRGQASLIGPIALTKFATLAAVPMALTRDPRGLGLGLAIAAGIVAASFAIAPGLWWDYARFLPNVTAQDPTWANIGRDIPYWARLLGAAIAAVAAVRWPRLAAVAATLALPILWYAGLSVLVAVVARPAAQRTRFWHSRS